MKASSLRLHNRPEIVESIEDQEIFPYTSLGGLMVKASVNNCM